MEENMSKNISITQITKNATLMIGNIFLNMICSVIENEHHICLLTHKAKLRKRFWRQRYCSFKTEL